MRPQTKTRRSPLTRLGADAGSCDDNELVAKKRTAVATEVVEQRIYFVRGQKVMLDGDLSELYEVPTKVLNQAVKRNLYRFPDDFLFQLTFEETESLRSQIVTSNEGRGGRRYLPYAFTEHEVAMLSSVLNSK